MDSVSLCCFNHSVAYWTPSVSFTWVLHMKCRGPTKNHIDERICANKSNMRAHTRIPSALYPNLGSYAIPTSKRKTRLTDDTSKL